MRNLGSSVLHRVIDPPKTADLAASCYIAAGATEDDGWIKALDLSSGAGVTCLGYSNQPVIDAIRDQVGILPYVHSTNWANKPAEQLAEMVLEEAGPAFAHGRVLFLNGGAEAVEAACKLTVQYFQEDKKRNGVTFFARDHSYHGNTAFTMALGNHPRKEPYSVICDGIGRRIIRFPAFKPAWDEPTDITVYEDKCLDYLETALKGFYKNRMPVAIVIETIGGTTIGIEPPTARYLARIREMVDANPGRAILIYDEVLSGNFRSGAMFAWQRYQRQTDKNLAPDIMAVGKGLSGGYLPLSAVIVSEKIVAAIRQGSHRLWHSTTNQNHPLGCAAGVAAMGQYRAFRDSGQLGTLESLLHMAFESLALSPHYETISGVGSLWGMRLKNQRPGFHTKVREAALREGLSVYTEGGTVMGKGNFVLIAPPYCISREALSEGLERLNQVIAKEAAGG